MSLLPHKRRKSARVIVIRDGKLLVFYRKRFSKITGEWIEYYSIPGGGIERGEAPESAAVRELKEEMGVEVRLLKEVAHSKSRNFEHVIYLAEIEKGEPALQLDSEEAASMSDTNQFVVEWVDVESLTKPKLRYYGQYYDLIQRLAKGEVPEKPLQLDV